MTPQQFFAFFPIGTIFPFAGDTHDIPVGWKICDGSPGTPNLNHRAPVGTTSMAEVGLEAGSDQHQHGVTQLATNTVGGGIPHVQEQDNSPVAPCGNHSHSLTGQTDNASSWQPSTYVMYIIRTV
jgi:hypothetical protein